MSEVNFFEYLLSFNRIEKSINWNECVLFLVVEIFKSNGTRIN